MHKITKGLKKKKKGKKSKRKEEELFKPEELEVYRKEHQGISEDSAEKNEEWKKFIALTSGVDDILKKTQGDLDRIKSTSFFQRKPTASEVKRREEEESKAPEEQCQPKEEQEISQHQLGIVEVSESESEEEDDDNIFDTAYIDAIAAGEVKLAYIPESPTDKLEGDDPFDTSIAERAILGPEVCRKGKKLVPIGAAVEVLTGRVQLPTCATKRPISKRQIFKERDLLLGSFDDNLDTGVGGNAPAEEVQKTLLDDDAIPISEEPIKLIQSHNQDTTYSNSHETVDRSKDIINEFDTIINASDDPHDKEFEALAAESLSKPVKVLHTLPLTNSAAPAEDIRWNAFEDKHTSPLEVDPFDTSFAENVFPGKKELKIIEKEILINDDADFKLLEQPQGVKEVSIQITDTVRRSNIIQTENRVLESELNLIKPIHRDLLGGSNTDLSVLSNQPQQSANEVPASSIEYSDPFDASVADFIKKPGVSLLVETELITEDHLSDDDFDPRAEEKSRERIISRPDVLNISGAKTVSFDVTSPEDNELLGTGEGGKIIKPLTPFYIRKKSVPELPLEEELSDPFDTSFASNIAPGKAELKVIESELFDPVIEKGLSFVDNDFDPRDDKKAEINKVVNIIKDISNVKLATAATPAAAVDLLVIDTNISVKVLTPGEKLESASELSYCDPFDTSAIAGNILPGKTELKLLETELIYSENVNLDLEKPLDDLLKNSDDIIIDRPLSPSGSSVRLSSISNQEDFDPFDTSIANNIQPGKAELKLLESEFI